MLATPGDLPTGPGWVYEVKWDGMRLLADVAESRLDLRSRSGRDVTANFPELGALVRRMNELTGEPLLDAARVEREVVARDREMANAFTKEFANELTQSMQELGVVK